MAADLRITLGKPNGQYVALADYFPNGDAFVPRPSYSQGHQGQHDVAQWYFVDRQNAVQGPFTSPHMRRWHMAGYFEASLQVMNNSLPGMCDVVGVIVRGCVIVKDLGYSIGILVVM